MTSGILLYSNNALPKKLRDYCTKSLVVNAGDIHITVVSQSPWPADKRITNLVYPTCLLPCTGSIYTQILYGLENMKEDYVYFCEHDCLYDHSHFSAPVIPGTLCYNQNVLRLNHMGFFAYDEPRPGRFSMLSCLSGWRTQLIDIFKRRLANVHAGFFYPWVEPDELPISEYESAVPTIDIRLGHNFTGGRVSSKGEYFPRTQWGDASTLVYNLVDTTPRKVPGRTLVFCTVFGNFDCQFVPPTPLQVDSMCSYLCITDGSNNRFNIMEAYGPYAVIVDEKEAGLSPRMASRKYKMGVDFRKIIPNFDDFEYTIHHDTSITITNPAEAFGFNEQADWHGFKHNRRHCLYDESRYCRTIGKMPWTMLEKAKQFTDNIKDRVPRGLGLSENGIITRRNSDKVRRFGQDWWVRYIKSGFDNDQVMLPALLHKSDMVFCPIGGNVYQNAASAFHIEKHAL